MAKSKASRFTFFTFGFTLIGLAGLLYLLRVSGWMLEAWGSNYYSTSTVADFDGDGSLDVVVAHARYVSQSTDLAEAEATVFAHTTLWTNQGQAGFSPLRIGYSSSAAAGDLDGDGDIDILTSSGWQLEILLNQGGLQGGVIGQFEVYGNPVRPQGEAGAIGSVLLADLDSDGDLDGFAASGCSPLVDESQGGVAAKSYMPSHAWVWLNNWDPPGWLDRQTYMLPELGDLYMRAGLGDLDGDGSPDVFLGVRAACPGGYDGHPDLVLMNDGAGNLRDSGQRLGQADSKAVALGDLDGDGDLDALVGSPDGTLAWINQGGAQAGQAGRFEAAAVIDSGDTVHLFLQDFDGDGHLDALVANRRSARIWWNDGQASFTGSARPVFRFSVRHGLAVGDFDGDGRPDIFAGAYNDSHLLWLNQGDRDFRIANNR